MQHEQKWNAVLEELNELREGVDCRHDELLREWKEYQRTIDERLKAIDKTGKVDPLVEEKLARLSDSITERVDAFEKQFTERADRLETAFKRNFAADRGDAGPEVKFSEAVEWKKAVLVGRNELPRGGIDPETVSIDECQSYIKAFRKYLRAEQALSPDDMKALSVGSAQDGGYTVTPAMSGRIISAVFESSPIRQLATVETISTSSYQAIADPNDITAGWVGERGSRSATATGAIERPEIFVHEMYANPPVTQKLLDDSSIDIEAWLSRKIADKFARMEATAFVKGSGVDRPRGITSYPAGTSWGQIEQINSGAASNVTYDGLVELSTSLKEPYANNAVMLMNRRSIRAIMQLKDSQNRPLWIPNLQAGQPSTLLGFPVRFANDFDDATTSNALAIALGDIREAYTVVDRIGIRLIRDPYTSKPDVLFYTTRRVGGQVVNFEAVKLLKISA